MRVGGWSGGYMGEGRGVEGTWVRVGGGWYAGEGRGWGGGYIFNTFNTPMQRPKINFVPFF